MMHWFYLAVFLLILAVPQVFRRDLPWLPEEHLESAVIFCLGLIGFVMFLFREEQFRKQIREKFRYQRQANAISKDLVQSYSYIGEINRKLEILKNAALGLPSVEDFTPAKRQEAYDAVLEAVAALGKCERFTLHFVDTRTSTVIETLSAGHPRWKFSGRALLGYKNGALSKKGRLVVRAPKTLRHHAAFIVLDQKSAHTEDLDLLRAVLAQALFLFVWERENPALPLSA